MSGRISGVQVDWQQTGTRVSRPDRRREGVNKGQETQKRGKAVDTLEIKEKHSQNMTSKFMKRHQIWLKRE